MTIKECKNKSEVILTWVTIIAIVFGGIKACSEYNEHKALVRAERTMEFLSRFRSPELSKYREELSKTWFENDAELNSMLTNKETTQDQINRNYYEFVLRVINEKKLYVPALEMLNYLEQLTIGIESNLFDENIVNSLLGKYGQSFLRQYYPFICDVRKRWNDPNFGKSVEKFFNQGIIENLCER